jgi:antitoxin (DNA-binding transcriptional repressor) of toxin-antitoxin stability system
MKDRKMTVTEASRNFAEVVNRSYYRGESTILYRSGEAVARITPVGGFAITGHEFAEHWREMSHLDPQDAKDFHDTITEARSHHSMPESKWD